MVFYEGLLEQGGEAETLRVACVGAVREQGVPFVFEGSGLREQVAEKLLGHAVDLLRRFREAEDGGWEPP
jgi:phosphoglycerate dehydrogenase-like enzyme